MFCFAWINLLWPADQIDPISGWPEHKSRLATGVKLVDDMTADPSLGLFSMGQKFKMTEQRDAYS